VRMGSRRAESIPEHRHAVCVIARDPFVPGLSTSRMMKKAVRQHPISNSEGSETGQNSIVLAVESWRLGVNTGFSSA
jgi:hypothetical protein